jgi:hypothetical protein
MGLSETVGARGLRMVLGHQTKKKSEVLNL